MPKPLYINRKISLRYSDTKGKCYISLNRIEPHELLFRIPLKDCLHRPRDDSLVIFTYPLIRVVMDDAGRLTKYYSFDKYKDICPMYVPVYNLQSECRKHKLCYKTIAVQYLLTLHILYVLTFVHPIHTDFSKERYEKVIHAWHIVDSRCVENKQTKQTYMVDHFDDLNHSSTPNVSYTFESKYMIIRAKERIAPYTEICDSYGSGLSREKIFMHYYFVSEESSSDSIYPNDEPTPKAHFDYLLARLETDTFISVYDFYIKYMDDKHVVYHLESLLR